MSRARGSVLVRGLVHRLRAREEVLPIELGLALGAAIARRIDDVLPPILTPTSVVLYFDGGVELVEVWTGTVADLGSIAPEQHLPGEPEVSATAGGVFGAGAILFELLTGQSPFLRDTEDATIQAVVSEPLPGPSTIRDGVPAAIDVVIESAMEKDHRDRYPTGAALADAIEAVAAANGITLAMEEVGKTAKRLVNGVRLAHTLRAITNNGAGTPGEDRSTRKMRITDIVALGIDRAAVTASEPTRTVSLGEPPERPPAPRDVLQIRIDGVKATMASASIPVVVDDGPTPASPASPASPARSEQTTARLRQRRATGSIAALALAAAVVALVAVPVFTDDGRGPAAAPVVAANALDRVIGAAPIVGAVAPAARSAVVAPATTVGAVAPVPVPVPVPPKPAAEIVPASDLAERAAGELARRAAGRRDWTGAARACARATELSSRKLRALCALAACRAERWDDHASYLRGLSSSRRSEIKRKCDGPST
jgi:hypothetical protein